MALVESVEEGLGARWVARPRLEFGLPGRLAPVHDLLPGMHLLVDAEETWKNRWFQALAAGAAQILSEGPDGRPKPEGLACFWQDPRAPLSAEQAAQPALDWAAAQAARWPAWGEAAWGEHVQGLGLAEHLHKPLYQLSTGTRRKLWLAAALASAAELTLIDEPFAALDGGSIRYLRQTLQALTLTLEQGPARWVLVGHYELLEQVDWTSVLT